MSAHFTLAEAAAWCGGRVRSGRAERACVGVSIDSRTLDPGALFVAIRGERHDAHRFTAEVAARGAALLVETGRDVPDGADAIEVEDTTAALQALGRGVRRRFPGPVIAITGSNGKTSTKELCAAALGTGARVVKTEGNLNNHYGVPLTLLRIDDECEVAVVEMGTNHPGEIATLAAIAEPSVGVLTNVGTAHAEYLGSREGIAREKGSLFEALPATGVAVANADDPFVMSQLARTAARVLRFGRGPEAEVTAEDVESRGLRGYRFRLRTPFGDADTGIPNLGEVHIHNALAAAAAALATGADLGAVARGLEHAPVVGGRLEPVALPGGAWVLNDSYNANPQSAGAALETLTRLAAAGRSIAVLGDMGELGPGAEQFHRELGARAAALGVDALYAVGEAARETADGALGAGLGTAAVHWLPDAAAAAEALRASLREGDWLLLKGSRSMRMETVLETLQGGGGD